MSLKNSKQERKKLAMSSYKNLFASFFKIGAFTFGGGYAMLPMLEREVVDNHGWASSEELLDFYAISQCTPGVIAVNVATMVGSREAGVVGAAFATLGVVCPSFFIILAIASALDFVSHLAVIGHAFAGIRVAVGVLIFSTILKLLKSSVQDKLTALIFGATLAAMLLLDVTPVLIVAVAAFVGIIAKALKAGAQK